MLPPARMSYATLYVQAACYLPVLTCHPWPQLGHIREAEWVLLQLLCHFVLPWSAFICPLGVPSCSSRIPYWCSSVFSRYSPITLLTVIFCVNLMSRCLVKHDSACVWEGEGVVRLIPEWVDSVKQCVFPNMDQPHMILWRREWKSNSPGKREHLRSDSLQKDIKLCWKLLDSQACCPLYRYHWPRAGFAGSRSWDLTTCLRRPEEGIRPCGTGVTGGCALWVLGHERWASRRAANALGHWAVCLSSL